MLRVAEETERKRVLAVALLVGLFGTWAFGNQQSRQETERQVAGQKEKQQHDLEAVRQREIREQERVAQERKITADTDAEKGRLPAAQRTKEEAAREKENSTKAIAKATKELPYENTLEMKFVPVAGTGVLFSVWETRVKDFRAFVEVTKYDAEDWMYSLEKKGWVRKRRTWKDPGFAQTEEHAVCGMNWEDATAFCEWLTEQERKAARINGRQSYRLPSDEEWSAAVGLARESGTTPKERNGKVKGVYPWGTSFPPPAGAGNYAGSEARTENTPSDWRALEGYRDEYARTAAVRSFQANENGIYDLGGNVWEWCQDWYDAERKYRVLRGASWVGDAPHFLLSAFRDSGIPKHRGSNRGFRCVLVVDSSR